MFTDQETRHKDPTSNERNLKFTGSQAEDPNNEFVEVLRECANRLVCESLSDFDLAGVVFWVDVVFKGRREEGEWNCGRKVFQPVVSNFASVLVKPPDFKTSFAAHLLRQ